MVIDVNMGYPGIKKRYWILGLHHQLHTHRLLQSDVPVSRHIQATPTHTQAAADKNDTPRCLP